MTVTVINENTLRDGFLGYSRHSQSTDFPGEFHTIKKREEISKRYHHK